MNCFIYGIYILTIGIIRILKWIELPLVKLIQPCLKKRVYEELEKTGVVVHRPHEDKESFLSPATQEIDLTYLLGGRGSLTRPIHVEEHNTSYITRTMHLGSLGFAESFLDKSWDCFDGRWEDLTELLCRLYDKKYMALFYKWNPLNILYEWLEREAFNLQTRERAFQVGKAHYDLGNDLHETMMGSTMQYSAAYWKDAQNLHDAQIAKMDMIARKLELKPGMRVLDLGCGWGTLSKYLAETYKVEIVGVTIGKEGAAYGQRLCAGLPVDIRVQDYRDCREKFDRIISIEALEHMGRSNHREFFTVISRCLKDDGICLIQTVGINHYEHPKHTEGFLHKYMFPNSMSADTTDIANKTRGLLLIEDWHNIGQDFAITFGVWRNNFMEGWPKLEAKYGGEKFFRMWMFYLSFMRAMFLVRKLDVWQVVMSKNGIRHNYRAFR